MKKIVLAGLAALSLTAPAAFAQQGYYPGGGYGCGMMGPGMMGGYGMCSGMMGPGMMGGYGYGYGGPPSGIDLTQEQRDKIDRINDDLAKKETPLTEQIYQERRKLQEMYYSGADPATLDQAYRKTTDLERQVFDARADAQKRMDAVLTKEQRDRMQRMRRGYGYDMWDWW